MFPTFKSKTSAKKKVTFEHYAPGAQKVQLAGSFNGWNPAKTSLKHQGNGKWKVTLDFPPGRYEYRYCVDGDWQNDQRTVECVPNPFGTWNCVLKIQK